jgi:hypothetical protein
MKILFFSLFVHCGSEVQGALHRVQQPDFRPRRKVQAGGWSLQVSSHWFPDISLASHWSRLSYSDIHPHGKVQAGGRIIKSTQLPLVSTYFPSFSLVQIITFRYSSSWNSSSWRGDHQVTSHWFTHISLASHWSIISHSDIRPRGEV